MPRHDVYALRDGALVLDVQADLLEPLKTRIVVPLLPRASAPKPARGLNPVFLLGETEMVMVTQFLAAVPLAEMGAALGSLDAHHDDITRALDMAFQGI
ncbi:hypothetical protein LCGC14_0046800 [marine sediment metagenome]|jgi:toxin CcdB|uniref:Toxin CcdB n=2 Tax=root TaxID=1 RepID=A0A7V1BGT6_9RHOB|nr:CcdB family protein [Sulfitobacter litoralis]OUU27029.1 MAG: plasmid maintenance protein CcdB [Candidatus Endolissoclinum sp. TMED37]HDZ52991.1 plasmid maintenance protein CcdB [Sulfitobacter litoralis]|tara:strand:- start:220 stop:516 length:297 start_codon:yes stop_codon:yes gene_type:complete